MTALVDGKAEELQHGDLLHLRRGNYTTVERLEFLPPGLVEDADDIIDVIAIDGCTYVRRRGDAVQYIRPER